MDNKEEMVKRFYVLFFLIFCFNLFSYWEWTPETGRWINPKYAVKDTPKEQFEWAEKFRREGDFEKAIREHRKLIKHYPNSEYAPKSYFSLGEIYEKLGKYERAFEEYQKIIDNYPDSDLIFSAVERQYEIVEKLLKKKTFKLFRFPIFGSEEAKIEKLKKVIENDPYNREAGERYKKLAELYIKSRKYDEAKKIFEKIKKEFPDTELEEEADYYILKIEYLSIPKRSTDIEPFEKLEEKIENFLKLYPESKYASELKKIKNEIRKEGAKRLYEIARFYERTKKVKAAEIYYRKIIEKFPESEYGKIAKKKLASP